MDRLDKILCSQGTLTRSEAGKRIRSGRVTVDGQVCRLPAQKVDPDRQRIAVDKQELGYARHIYCMLNKPAGVLCVSRDPKVPTVVDLLPEDYRRRGLFPAGRLDKDTRGLVLITDDGELSHRILASRSHVVKRYLARLDGPLDEAAQQAFRAGPVLEDGTRCMPAGLTVLEGGDNPLTEVAICEGKFHQIKRMFHSVGRTVTDLRRISMGGLQLDKSLPEGGCRLLTPEELGSLLDDRVQLCKTGKNP